MLFPGISYSWVLAGVSGGLGLQGTQKRQCLTPEPAALHCFSALTILHVRNWFQKEAPSSKLNRTPPANPRHIFTRGHATFPWLQHQLSTQDSSQAVCSHCPDPLTRKPTKPSVMS